MAHATAETAPAMVGKDVPTKIAPYEVAGIRCEYTPLDVVLQQLNMTKEEMEANLAVNKDWAVPAHATGWKLSHDAIRLDMDNFLAAIVKTREQVEAGTTLQAWQVANYAAIAKDFHHNIHGHHEHEEQIFFPWMESRVRVPEKMSADHKTLLELLDKVVDMCTKQMRPDMELGAAKALLADLESTFSTMRAHMRQHLEEEEIVGLPLLRKHFNMAEFMKCEKKIVATLTPADMAWFLRPMATEQKLATMTEFKIPSLIQKLVMMPAVRKDDRTIMQMLRDLKAGQPAPQPKKTGFLCFAA